MKFSDSFVFASDEYTTFENFVAAPYFRKSFEIKNSVKHCEITISGLGFYRLYINGTEITKGLLAPYISNPDDIVYFDSYDIAEYLTDGVNVVGIQLGNGMQNCPGGQVWDFEKARFRGAPRLAFCIEGEDSVGGTFSYEADETVKTARSPLYFDDLRCGERYNAQLEIPSWNLPGFDDSDWDNAKLCEKPRGEFRLCEAEPVKPTGEELTAVLIREAVLAEYHPSDHVKDIVPREKAGERSGILYDFGVNKTGYCRLKIHGRAGQRLELQYAEHINPDGEVTYDNICFYPDGYSQRDVYICKGEGEEVFEPAFTYHGFRYCVVIGIDAEQATQELLTYVVCNSALSERGSFSCSDETANTLQELCRISDLSNFFYFPTDCPHREKNGWTGDAAISAEHMLMNLTVEKSYIEWLRNVRAAQREDGALPGIVPTGGWGFSWGNGPAWDAVLTYLPYYTYVYTGNRQILEENATAILRYLNYISLNRTSRGTVDLGLGDWCPVGGKRKVSTEFTDTLTVMSIVKKAAFIFDVLKLDIQKTFAEGLYASVRAAARKHLVNLNTMTAHELCQSAQAMAIYFDVFEPGEKTEAFRVLKRLINKNADFMDVGILGARVMFHVLSDFGESELAYKMICRREWPSYGRFLEQGMTSLPEDFYEGNDINSLNHHFFGDISNWFIARVAGIRYNPKGDDCRELVIQPSFIEKLSFAKAHFDSPYGRIDVKWEREDEAVILEAIFPQELRCTVQLGNGMVIEESGMTDKQIKSGEKIIVRRI